MPGRLHTVTVRVNVMQWWQIGSILLAGFAAGGINAAVGSGTLITFPVLLALGVPPVTANISNSLGLLPASVAGTWVYRGELAGRSAVLGRLVPASLLGGSIGAGLLLVLPARAFEAVVPVLILAALALILLQPWLSRRMAVAAEGHQVRAVGAGLLSGVFLVAVYGGYFGAAQGVLLMGLLGWLLTDDLQIANGVKNLLAVGTGAIAGLVFVITAADEVDWLVAGLIAVGSAAGGVLGGHLARRMPAPVLRAVIVAVGLVAIARLVFG